MTVANTTTKLQYKGNGENRMFGITFPLADGSHLRLFLTTPQGVESEITKNFAFSDTLDSVTYPTLESGMEALADGYTLTLLLRHVLVWICPALPRAETRLKTLPPRK